MVDLRGFMGTMWPGHELFTIEHADYGFNPFALISSHPSQYWFAVHGLYLDDPDAIDDVSDVYDATLCGKMTLKFIGYFSFLLIMAKLLAMGLTRLCYGGMV